MKHPPGKAHVAKALRNLLQDSLPPAVLAAIEKKISYLTVSVDAQAAAQRGLVVRKDNAAFDESTLGLDVPVDPGTYRISASAEGFELYSVEVRVRPDGDRKLAQVRPKHIEYGEPLVDLLTPLGLMRRPTQCDDGRRGTDANDEGNTNVPDDEAMSHGAQEDGTGASLFTEALKSNR